MTLDQLHDADFGAWRADLRHGQPMLDDEPLGDEAILPTLIKINGRPHSLFFIVDGTAINVTEQRVKDVTRYLLTRHHVEIAVVCLLARTHHEHLLFGGGEIRQHSIDVRVAEQQLFGASIQVQTISE